MTLSKVHFSCTVLLKCKLPKVNVNVSYLKCLKYLKSILKKEIKHFKFWNGNSNRVKASIREIVS